MRESGERERREIERRERGYCVCVIRARRGNKFVTLTASAILEYTFVRS